MENFVYVDEVMFVVVDGQRLNEVVVVMLEAGVVLAAVMVAVVVPVVVGVVVEVIGVVVIKLTVALLPL